MLQTAVIETGVQKQRKSPTRCLASGDSLLLQIDWMDTQLCQWQQRLQGSRFPERGGENKEALEAARIAKRRARHRKAWIARRRQMAEEFFELYHQYADRYNELHDQAESLQAQAQQVLNNFGPGDVVNSLLDQADAIAEQAARYFEWTNQAYDRFTEARRAADDAIDDLIRDHEAAAEFFEQAGDHFNAALCRMEIAQVRRPELLLKPVFGLNEELTELSAAHEFTFYDFGEFARQHRETARRLKQAAEQFELAGKPLEARHARQQAQQHIDSAILYLEAAVFSATELGEPDFAEEYREELQQLQQQ